MPEGASAATELAQDHREVQDMLEQAVAAPRGAGTRRILVAEASARWMRHAEAERRYLLPVMRDYLPQGPDYVDIQAGHDSRIERILREMEPLAATDPWFDELLERLVIDVIGHIEAQETRLLPMLVDLCSPEVLNKLGTDLRAAKEETEHRLPTASE